MELFLPSIVILLICAIIIFVVLPRIGAPILAILAILLLIFGVYNHYKLFANEYRYSTWQDQFKLYGPFVMIGALILGILTYIGFLFKTKGVNALPASNLPQNTAIAEAANVAVENATGVVNQAANVVTKAANVVGNAVTNVKNAVGLGYKNNRNSRNGIVENLGQILATPIRKINNRM